MKRILMLLMVIALGAIVYGQNQDVYSNIFQEGTDNEVIVTQINKNFSYIKQIGVANEVLVDQSSSSGDYRSELKIIQTGKENDLSVNQLDITGVADIEQIGEGNNASIEQYKGKDLKIEFTQSRNIDLFSMANIIQEGGISNSIIAISEDEDEEVVLDLKQIGGTSNSMEFIQHDAVFNWLEARQYDGENNSIKGTFNSSSGLTCTYQYDGSHNSIEATQYKYASLDAVQFGGAYNTIEVTQFIGEYVAVGQSNVFFSSIEINQFGGGYVAAFQRNGSYLTMDITSCGSYVSVTQEDGSYLTFDIYSEGINDLCAKQSNTSNSDMTISQIGSNFIEAVQEEGSNLSADINQVGGHHYTYLYQTGDCSISEMEIIQSGYDNVALAEQYSFNPEYSLYSGITQNGESNTATVIQTTY